MRPISQRVVVATFVFCAMLGGPSRANRGPSPAPPTLIGRWRVVGCATSPRDPANCAHGQIVFDAARWSVSLPCCKRASAYSVITATARRIQISSDGVVSEIHFDSNGEARWAPGGLGGRVGALSFVRERGP